MDSKEEQFNFAPFYQNQGLIDSREEVSDILKFPSNIVVYIKTCFYKKGDAKKQRIGCIHGSGVLIAPLTVLTCAHNLVPQILSKTEKYETSPQRIICYQAYHQHLGYQYPIEEYFIPELYMENKQLDTSIAKKYDFALIFLKDKKYPVQSVYPSRLQDQPTLRDTYIKQKASIISLGYPSDKNRDKLISFKRNITNDNIIGYQYQSKGNLISDEDYFMWYDMKAVQGQSGSPLFVVKDKELILVGIHKGQNLLKQQSYGIPLWAMKQQLDKWQTNILQNNLF